MKITEAIQSELIDVAREFATRAYAPYSDFPVGAALLVDDGSIIGGANIENASYPLSICAERSAVATAASRGHRVVHAIAISAPKAPATTPCGGCRQMLNEFKPPESDMLVLLDEGSSWQVTSLAVLLPHSFGPKDLDRADL